MDIRTQPKKIIVTSLFLLLLGGLGVGALIITNTTRRSTDSRSKANRTDTATLEVETLPDSSTGRTRFSITSDLSGLDAATRARTVETDIIISSQEKVLGISTERKEGSVQFTTLPKPPITQTVTICFTDVIEDELTSNLYWSSSCKGDPKGGICTPAKIELTGNEKTMYDAWISLNRPAKVACRAVETTISKAPADAEQTAQIFRTISRKSGRKATASAIPVTTAPATVAAKIAATATPVPMRVIYDTAPIQIVSQVPGLTFEAPTVDVSADGRLIRIHLRMTISDEATARILSGRAELATINLTSTAAAPWTARLSTKSIKGVIPDAPNVMLELIKPLISVTPEPTASVSATRIPETSPTTASASAQ